jgi:hypothetical protein
MSMASNGSVMSLCYTLTLRQLQVGDRTAQI